MNVNNQILSKDLDTTLSTDSASRLRSKDPEALKKACKGVESLFVNMMLKEMRKSIPKSGLFQESMQRDIYTSLFDQQVAQEVSGVGRGIGIADMLYEQLSRKM